MKTTLKFCVGMALLFLFFSQTTDAQILQTRSDIVENYGTPFSSGISENGEHYLFYKTPVTTKASGTYLQRKVLYFKKTEDGGETCYKWKILEPSSEMRLNINSFKENLVEIGEMQWKDYGKGIIYKMEEKNGVCSITAWYDSQVGLAKVYKW